MLWKHIIDIILHNSCLIMYFGNLSTLHRWTIIYVTTLTDTRLPVFKCSQGTFLYMYYFILV